MMAAENGQYGRSVVSEKETEVKSEGVQSGFPYRRNERERHSDPPPPPPPSLCIYIFLLHICQHNSFFLLTFWLIFRLNLRQIII